MHMKRYSIPKYWKLPKKANKFVVTPRAGPHGKSGCVPLLVLLRDVLKIADDASEARSVLKKGRILIDKRPRKDPNYPVGLMDIIEIPDAKVYYRASVDKAGLFIEEIKENEADKKLCRVQAKRTLKGGETQLSMHDGRNIRTDKKSYRPNDSLLIEIPSQKIIKHYGFEKNSPAMVIAGKNIGVRGKVKEVFDRKTMLESSRVVIQTKEGEMETVKEYVLVGDFK